MTEDLFRHLRIHANNQPIGSSSFMKKQIDVVDDLFDEKFIKKVSEKYHRCLFEYGNVSNNPDDAIFWISRHLEDATPLTECEYQQQIFAKICEYYKFTDIDVDDDNIYINGQTYKLDGSMHIDSEHRTKPDAHYTILYMVNWLHEGIQGFETNFGTVDFKPGRVVVFNSLKSHRGLSTEKLNNLRMTLTWKSCSVELDKDSPLVL